MKKLFIGMGMWLICNSAFAYPDCPMYKEYRCIPVHGNKIVCGCGL